MINNIGCYLDYLIPGIYIWIGNIQLSFPKYKYDASDYPLKLDSFIGFGIIFNTYNYFITLYSLDVIDVIEWENIFNENEHIPYKSLRK